MKALLMNDELGAGNETAAAMNQTEMPPEGETGDLLGALQQAFGGPGGAAMATAAAGDGSIGQTLGGLGGATLGTMIGGPAGTAFGAVLGRVGGKLAEGAITSVVKTHKKKKNLNQRQRRILADGLAASKRTGDPAYDEEARLRVYNPVEYRKRRDAGRLPTQISAMNRGARTSSTPPPAIERPIPPPEQPQPKPRIQFSQADIEAARERANQQRTETPPKTYQLQFPPGFVFPYGANSSIAPSEAEVALAQDEAREYNDTAAPQARPTPKRHLSVVPIPEGVLQKIKTDLPILNSLDPRFLRMATGATPGARDVSGVDSTTGQYIAAPGETAQGITKKLTGQHERTAELLAANPAHKPGNLAWNIPPGWLMYDRDTGAVMTRRSYIVQKDDTPYKIATKMGAISRPKWWAEMRAANPGKTVTNGNWTSLYPNEEIGIPDEWPETPLAKSVNPATPENPGLPSPAQNSTMDVGVVANTQILVAAWARRHGTCDPLDFGLQPSDFSGLVDARTQRALTSFQLWWNKWNPTRPLRTDGTIDSATQTALKEAVFSQVPAYGGQLPLPTPTPAPNPAPTPNPAPASPLPWPVYAGKPGMVVVSSPLGQLELPAQPGTTPGTVSILVPGYGRVDNVPVNGTFQPAPLPQPNPQPAPQPNPQPNPQPLPNTPKGIDGSAFPFPVSYSPKPGLVMVMTPAGQIEVPYEQGTKPGTICITVPQLGRVDNVPVSGSPPLPQIPTPQWPFPLPWTQPQPQPQPNPQPQQPTNNKSSKIKVDVPGYGPIEVNVEPGSKPGTVIVDAPVIGRREIPIRAGSTPGTVAADLPVIGTIDNIPLPPNIPAPPSARASSPEKPALPADPSQMPLDAHMSEQDQQTVRNMIQTTEDPGLLDMSATFYEGMGYPLAASALRAAANIIRATKMPPLGAYTLDSNLPAEAKELVEYTLKNTRDANAVEAMAQSYAQQGYPLTAKALADRATALRSFPYDSPDYPPAPSPYPNLPSPAPNPQEQSTNQGGSSGMLPLVAILGAFHLMA